MRKGKAGLENPLILAYWVFETDRNTLGRRASRFGPLRASSAVANPMLASRERRRYVLLLAVTHSYSPPYSSSIPLRIFPIVAAENPRDAKKRACFARSACVSGSWPNFLRHTA